MAYDVVGPHAVSSLPPSWVCDINMCSTDFSVDSISKNADIGTNSICIFRRKTCLESSNVCNTKPPGKGQRGVNLHVYLYTLYVPVPLIFDLSRAIL